MLGIFIGLLHSGSTADSLARSLLIAASEPLGLFLPLSLGALTGIILKKI